jgi:hypothetical protein
VLSGPNSPIVPRIDYFLPLEHGEVRLQLITQVFVPV